MQLYYSASPTMSDALRYVRDDESPCVLMAQTPSHKNENTNLDYLQKAIVVSLPALKKTEASTNLESTVLAS